MNNTIQFESEIIQKFEELSDSMTETVEFINNGLDDYDCNSLSAIYVVYRIIKEKEDYTTKNIEKYLNLLLQNDASFDYQASELMAYDFLRIHI